MAAYVGGSYVIDDPSVLIDALLDDGWRILGPRLGDGAIVYDEIHAAETLPRGLVDEQDGGRYRLSEGRPGNWFDYVVGPQSWKKWLYPARQKLWSATRSEDGFEIDQDTAHWPRTVLFGARACEIAAIEVQDKVFDNGDYADAGYRRRREQTLIVAVQCARAASTCFCASMDTGPRSKGGYDLALTELSGHGADGFLVECGSERGVEILGALAAAEAGRHHLDAAAAASRHAADTQTRRMPDDNAGVLRESLDHSRWAEIAERCLGCANCTLACPTCFCSDVEDVNDLSGDHAERWRVWDSCFSIDFSYIHGGAVRRSTQSRYRQWMTHKLSSWHDQFGTSGCVGCGRCIAWCPVGIDITAEAAAFAADVSREEA